MWSWSRRRKTGSRRKKPIRRAPQRAVRSGRFSPSEAQNDRSATEPLVIFTDGILAIAATLLFFQLQIPADLRADSLRHALCHQWPTFVAIMVGYLWLAAAWLTTRRLRRMLRGVDH